MIFRQMQIKCNFWSNGLTTSSMFPGATREQRGLRPRREIYEGGIDECTYSYSKWVMNILNRILGVQYIPCMPKEKKGTNRVSGEEIRL
ncbi:hypothetical protein GCK72_009896 [Caenorhabditis remanei]|uniref:Uncharacterized protein n=1 Tax=Caenorhabditis remanei TaxID=31234 RepID=A0A6A5H1F9_CAERE|nr:hypothetical protein GCK72_009896 [Caenorhabditis remanei]KAF1761640.1 hypothetical protein GCK72_009896 [Caenorhabditis remanei]